MPGDLLSKSETGAEGGEKEDTGTFFITNHEDDGDLYTFNSLQITLTTSQTLIEARRVLYLGTLFSEDPLREHLTNYRVPYLRTYFRKIRKRKYKAHACTLCPCKKDVLLSLEVLNSGYPSLFLLFD